MVADFQAGKEFGNNGQCNPTYFTVGNLVRHLQKLEREGLTRQQIIDNYVFFTAGSCGPCRFGMYEAEYRFALQNAGFDGFRVLLFQQTDGIKAASGEPGLKFSVDFGMGMLNALNLGDVVNELAYQIRPFEKNKGETDRVMREAVTTLTDTLRERKRWHIMDASPHWARPFLEKHKKIEGIGCTLGKVAHNLYGKEYVDALHACRDRIGSIEVDRLRVKPVIKITGEFWAQTTEGDGNFNMFAFLEKEGAQVLVEPIAAWIAYMMYVAKEGAKARADAQAAVSRSQLVRSQEDCREPAGAVQKDGGTERGKRDVDLFLSPHHPAHGRHGASPGSAEGVVAAGASVLSPVGARRRRLNGSGQERLLHGEPFVPHGAGAQALRVHAFDAVRRGAVAGGEQVQGHDFFAHRDFRRGRSERA